VRQMEADKRAREKARRDELKRQQMEQIADRRMREMAEREAQRAEDKRMLQLREQMYAEASSKPRTASRSRSRFVGHKALEATRKRPASADATLMRGYAPLQAVLPDDPEEAFATLRHADHAVFGLQVRPIYPYLGPYLGPYLSLSRPLSTPLNSSVFGLQVHPSTPATAPPHPPVVPCLCVTSLRVPVCFFPLSFSYYSPSRSTDYWSPMPSPAAPAPRSRSASASKPPWE